MSPRVQIAHADQTPASTAAVKRLHDLGRGVVVVYPTPGRGGEGIARDILQALGKRFRDRTLRDPRKLETLAMLWLRAERWVVGLLIAAAERRLAEDWSSPVAERTPVVRSDPSCGWTVRDSGLATGR